MRTMIAALVALAAATSSKAANLKIGFGMTGGTHDYLIYDDTNRPVVPQITTQGTAGISQAQGYLGTEALSQIGGGLMSPSDMIALGIEAGIGLPLGSHTFNHVDAYKPRATDTANKDSGDTTTVKLTSVPVLVKALYVTPLGSINASFGVAAGPTLIGWQQETLDVFWDDPTTLAFIDNDPDRGDATWTESGRRTSYAGDTAVVFTIRVTPGASFALNESDAIGAELPLSYNTTTVVSGAFQDLKTRINTSTVDPQSTKISVGGFGFGLNLVWTRRFGGGAPAAKKK